MGFWTRVVLTFTLAFIILATVMFAYAAPKLTCSQLQKYVTNYGMGAVIAYAERKGYSEAEIASYRKKCKITDIRSMQDASRKSDGLLQGAQKEETQTKDEIRFK